MLTRSHTAISFLRKIINAKGLRSWHQRMFWYLNKTWTLDLRRRKKNKDTYFNGADCVGLTAVREIKEAGGMIKQIVTPWQGACRGTVVIPCGMNQRHTGKRKQIAQLRKHFETLIP
jgi:hypothetical protein